MQRRLVFIDNVRWAAISMVVVMHAAVTYSPFGSWYFREHPRLDLPALVAFGTYQSFQHAVAMGLLFGIAGCFAGAAVDRKGPAGFLRERAVRLGLPLLAYTLAIGPLTEYYVAQSWRTREGFAAAWLRHLASGELASGSGPLWFCLVLLGFSLGYAGLRTLRRRPPPNRTWPVPGPIAVAGVAVVMAAATFTVGIVAPHGGTVLNVDIHDFPQYPLMFAAGVLAWRHDWLPRLAARAGGLWLGTGLLTTGALWAALILGGGALTGELSAYGGGWHWQAAGMDLWRSVTCLTLSVGILALARDHCDRQGPVARFLTRNAFGVYVVHAPILVVITRALHDWPVGVAAKFLFASAAGIAASFLFVGFVMRRTPGLRALV